MFLYTVIKFSAIPALSYILYIYCKKESIRNSRLRKRKNIDINQEYITSKSDLYTDRINELV